MYNFTAYNPTSYNKQVAYTPNGVLTNLVSYWTLDEPSGNRLDTVGSNHLSPTNTPGQTTGQILNAATFVASSQQYLAAADSASWTGVAAFTYTMWVNFTTTSGTKGIISKDDNGSNREFNIYTVAGVLQFDMFNQIGTASGALAGATPTTGVWNFIMAKWDGTTMSFSMNDGAPTTKAFSGTSVFNGTAAFEIGRKSQTNAQCTDGIVDEVGFWNRILTPAEITYLYNGGVGKAYPFTT